MLSLRDLGLRLLLPAMLVAVSTTTVAPPLGAPASPPSKAVVDHWPPYDDDLYGPHFITANPSSDTWYEDLFSTKLMPGAKYYLKVNNPAPGASAAVGNFSVKLNGVYVADPGMMGGQSELVKEVPLQAFNRIEVWTAPGSGQLRVIIRMEPMTHIAPAYAERVQPAPGQADVTKSWQVTVPADAGGNRILVIDNGDYDRSGRIGAQEWGEIKINGVHAATFDTLHLEQSKLVVPVNLPVGTSTIQATLNQVVPGAHVHVRLMYADTAKPKLTVSAPANGAVASSSSVTVSGTYNDPMWGSVNVGSAQSYQTLWMAHLAGVQSWSVSHPLNMGSNTIKIWARDGAGNTSDTLTRVVTRQSGGGGGITVAVQGRNAGVTIERDECLTIAAGDDAAYECGDLRIVHALPATRTMNRARAPTLIYNSSHATARALIAADVTLPTGMNADSVEATVLITGKENTVRRFPWSSAWSGGPARRIVVPVAGRTIGLPTGMYAYTFQVRALAGTSELGIMSDTGTVVVVDRSSTPFGAGWWLDGLEQFINVSAPSAEKMLWIGGDGSTRLYVRQGSSHTWLATPEVDRVDSLQRFVSFNPDGTPGAIIFRRKLRNGSFVEFDANGRHLATQNRQGHRTVFGYDGSLLNRITLPIPAPQSVAAPVYQFNYTTEPASQAPILTSVDAPSLPNDGRQVSFAYDAGTRRLNQIIEKRTAQSNPEVWVGFKYDSESRVIKRRNRRDDSTFFAFDEASLLRDVTVEMRRTNQPAIVSTFCAAEGRSVAACATGPQLLDKVYTLFNGPRTDKVDTTVLFVTRFGAPREIVNVLGARTTIERSHPRFPLLATAVNRPSAKDQDAQPYRVEAVYDSVRGLLESTRTVNPYGDGRDAVTRYLWHSKWDAVTSVAPPLVHATTFEYDTVTGNRTAVVEGGDRTRFGYDQGLVVSIRTSEGGLDTLLYDVRGNLRSHTTPLNSITASYADTIGRDTLVVLPPTHDGGVMRTRTEYDWADRPALTVSSGGTGGLADALEVTTTYDFEGNTATVTQRATPDRNGVSAVSRIFTYDAAHRKLKEVSGVYNAGPEWEYDPAGNVSALNRVVFQAYDALNRLERRQGTDTATFTYDALGNIKTANNEYAQVSRSYYRNGQLESETLRVATADSTVLDFSKHQYQVVYTYDLAGRRESVRHPSNLKPSGAPNTATQYSYDPRTGQIETVTDVFGVKFRHSYDAMGRLDSLIRRSALPDSATEARTYDLESRLKSRVERIVGGTVIRTDNLDYDPRGKIFVGSQGDEFVYHALGHLTHSCLYTAAGRCEDFELDALGNRKWTDRSGGHAFGREEYFYESGTARVVKQLSYPNLAPEPDTTTYGYNQALGQVTSTVAKKIIRQRSISGDPVYLNVITSNIYDAENRLTRVRVRIDTTGTLGDGTGQPPPAYVALESYRYDALGRRVWQRSYKDSSCPNVEPQTGCISYVKRTVWDGDDILYEIRTRGAASATAAELENDSPAYGVHYGVVGYTHGSVIDQPLGLFKGSTQVLPLANYRGLFDRGLCPATLCDDASIYFHGKASGVYGWPSRASGPPSWFGSLIEGMEDASGLQYKRNRYYDPQSGRFTQEDPIGLAGGLNLYGFTEGDPVNFSDPFGLQACYLWSDKRSPDCLRAQRNLETCSSGGPCEVTELEFPAIGPGGRGLTGAVRQLGVAGRRGANLLRHARDLRGWLIHVTPSDLRGAVRELRGLESGGRHLQEVREAVGGLRLFINSMTSALSNPELSQVERAVYSRFLGMASRALDEAEAALRSVR